MSAQGESDLIESAVETLASRLPPNWAVTSQPVRGTTDLDILVTTPQRTSYLLYVEARNTVSARDVEALIGGSWRRWRGRTGNPIVLVAPYIGPRVQELLTEQNVSFIDLTGNVRLIGDSVGLFVRMEGASQDPTVTKRRPGLSGPRVGTVIRVLIDATPPYWGVDVAKAAGVDPGYLSRILETLEDEGLVDRERSGAVISVDWSSLIVRRAETVNLFRGRGTTRYISRSGPSETLEYLREKGPDGRSAVVTGSFAASRLAAVAAPTLLVVYASRPQDIAGDLQLIPADAGADVVVIKSDGGSQTVGARTDRGIAWAAPSQVAIDCLAGSGRMPQEGMALIEWMRTHEESWRHTSIADLVEEWKSVSAE